ncbi:MAG: hypothetical protein WC326_05695 [Candidatus Delongbacteria bacterium]
MQRVPNRRFRPRTIRTILGLAVRVGLGYPTRLGLGLLYAFWALTLELHHNHGAETTPARPELGLPAAHVDPCPVQIFQQAHGDAWVDNQPEPWLAEAEAPLPALPGHLVRKPESCRSRGPPRLS